MWCYGLVIEKTWLLLLLFQTMEVSVAELVGTRWVPKQYLHHTISSYLLWQPETYPMVLSFFFFICTSVLYLLASLSFFNCLCVGINPCEDHSAVVVIAENRCIFISLKRSKDLFKEKWSVIVQGEKGLALFNYMVTQGTTAFLSSLSVPFIDTGNSRLVWLRGIHRIYLFSVSFVLIWLHTRDWFKTIFIRF